MNTINYCNKHLFNKLRNIFFFALAVPYVLFLFLATLNELILYPRIVKKSVIINWTFNVIIHNNYKVEYTNEEQKCLKSSFLPHIVVNFS